MLDFLEASSITPGSKGKLTAKSPDGTSTVVIGGAALNRPLTQPGDQRSYQFSVVADPSALPHLDSHRVRLGRGLEM